jgi:hypothetical protein
MIAPVSLIIDHNKVCVGNLNTLKSLAKNIQIKFEPKVPSSSAKAPIKEGISNIKKMQEAI